MPNPETVLDHYKIWQIAAQKFPHAATLVDQFFPNQQSPLHAQVDSLQWICNPVMKNGSRLLHPPVHLTGYHFVTHDQFKSQSVRIQDQFTKGQWVTWWLGPPDHLLLPAAKALKGQKLGNVPTVVDHFVCYRVTDAGNVTVTVTLEDQFDAVIKKKEEVPQLVPKYLGVPAQKLEHGGSKILHAEAHLAIYAIVPRSHAISFSARDQFHTWESLSTVQALYLAVPALKTANQ